MTNIDNARDKPANKKRRKKQPQALRLPHERDQSLDMTDDKPDALMRQAHEDLQRGLEDTDRGPVMDKIYRRLKR